MDFVIGGTAALCAGFFTNPLEVVKTRMQLQGELASRGKYAVRYKNVFHAAFVIGKHDGILALQAGLVPASLFQVFLNGVRFGLYQVLMDRGLMKDEKGELVFYKTVIGGSVVGAAGACAGSPFYLVKVHLQSQASKEIAFGHQHHHEGTWDALIKIYSQYGIKGLYRGVTSAIPRVSMGSMSQLTSYSYSKQFFVENNLLTDSSFTTSVVCSMLAGAVAVVFMAPFDVVSTRIYNQGVNEHGKGLLYKGYLDCVAKIWKTEGFLGFYKGLGACYFRLGPHTVLSLTFWDQFKNLYEKFKSTEEETY